MLYLGQKGAENNICKGHVHKDGAATCTVNQDQTPASFPVMNYFVFPQPRELVIKQKIIIVNKERAISCIAEFNFLNLKKSFFYRQAALYTGRKV